MRSAVLCILICRCLTAQNAASIDGVVIDITTHQPLPGVHISLRGDGLDAWGAISNKDGRFSIASIPPDDYHLSARRNGYVRVPSKDETADEDAEATLSAGEHQSGFIVEMTPRAAIAGRVTDENGDPVAFAQLQAIPADARRPGEILGMWTQTDDRGQYRMTGLPGTYYICASNNRMQVDRGEIRSDGAAPAYAITWYLSAVSQEQGRVVEVAAGRDATGIDIRLARALSLTIGGVVTGQGDSSVSILVRAKEEGFSPFFDAQRIAPAGPDGKFRVSGLPPGTYNVTAVAGDLRSPSVEAPLQTTDETGLTLRLTAGEELAGTLVIEGGSAKNAVPEKLTVQLRNSAGRSQEAGSDVDGDGAFRLERVFPDTFQVDVVPLPENAYVKSLKLDSVQSQSNELDLTRGVGNAKLTVVVNLNGAQVAGTVTDAEGKPLENPRPLVALATKPEDIRNNTIARAEAGGHFRFNGVRPGKYRLVAIDSRQYNRDPGPLRNAFALAAEFEVGEGSRIERDVKVTAAETPDAKP